MGNKLESNCMRDEQAHKPLLNTKIRSRSVEQPRRWNYPLLVLKWATTDGFEWGMNSSALDSQGSAPNHGNLGPDSEYARGQYERRTNENTWKDDCAVFG